MGVGERPQNQVKFLGAAVMALEHQLFALPLQFLHVDTLSSFTFGA